MKLKRIKFHDTNFDSLLSKINGSSLYLIKHQKSWVVSKFYYQPSPYDNLHDPFNWEYNFKGMHIKLSYGSASYKIEGIEELYELLE